MKIFNTYFIHEIFVVRNHNYRACIIFDCRRDDFDALNIQIIRRLIQNEHVRSIVTDHQYSKKQVSSFHRHLISGKICPIRLPETGSG